MSAGAASLGASVFHIACTREQYDRSPIHGRLQARTPRVTTKLSFVALTRVAHSAGLVVDANLLRELVAAFSHAFLLVSWKRRVAIDGAAGYQQRRQEKKQ